MCVKVNRHLQAAPSIRPPQQSSSATRFINAATPPPCFPIPGRVCVVPLSDTLTSSKQTLRRDPNDQNSNLEPTFAVESRVSNNVPPWCLVLGAWLSVTGHCCHASSCLPPKLSLGARMDPKDACKIGEASCQRRLSISEGYRPR